MKVLLSVLTFSMVCAIALAQEKPADPQSQPASQSAPASRQATPAEQQTSPANQQPAPANQQTATQPSEKAGSENKPAEMKTSTFKGVLVDMSCASPTAGGQATQAADTTKSADATKTADTQKKPADIGKTKASDESNSANRSTGESGTNCPVSASSTNFGMKLDDGRTVRFDLVGNQRAQDEIKNNKRWNKAISENKPIHAKVSGVMSGEKLIVSSIH